MKSLHRYFNVYTRISQSIRMFRWGFLLSEVGGGSSIAPRVVIKRPSRVRLGHDVSINEFVHIWGAGGLTLGDATLVAAHVTITTQTHDSSASERGQRYRDTSIERPVVIGSNVWIGSNATILPGVSIGDNSIVAAGSVVNRDVPPDCVVAGVPARKIRMLD